MASSTTVARLLGLGLKSMRIWESLPLAYPAIKRAEAHTVHNLTLASERRIALYTVPGKRGREKRWRVFSQMAVDSVVEGETLSLGGGKPETRRMVFCQLLYCATVTEGYHLGPSWTPARGMLRAFGAQHSSVRVVWQ